MIKKYGIGFLAIVLAIASVAFTTPGHITGALWSADFHYTGPNYSQTEVQKNSNWAPGAGNDCQTTKSKACQMTVDDTYTHDVSGTRVLNTTGAVLPITSFLGPDGVSYQPQTVTGKISAEIPKP